MAQFFKTCPECGAHLDSGERCDCTAAESPQKEYKSMANSSLYHCGWRWLVVDKKNNTISKHYEKKDAEAEAARLNAERLNAEGAP